MTYTRRDPRKLILGYVHDIIDRDGCAPSYDMICRDLNIRTRGEVRRYIVQLESQGCLRRVGNGRVRRIRLSSLLSEHAAA